MFAVALALGAGTSPLAQPDGTGTMLAHSTATAPTPGDPVAEDEPTQPQEWHPLALLSNGAPAPAAFDGSSGQLSDEEVLALRPEEDGGHERGSLAFLEEDEEAEAEEEDPPIFREHEVQAGETVSEIAERYGVGTDHILWNNIDILVDADSLSVGTVLQVPSVAGIIHSVRLGETVSGIAEHYDASIADIVDFTANGFEGDPDNLPEGSLILVPGGRMPEPPPVEEPEQPEEPAPPAPTSTPAPSAPSQPTPRAEPTPPPVSPTAPGQWVWPARGRITNLFSARHPLGIDISMVVGTRLAASAPGQVVFVGGNPCCSYGYHVIIRHENGYESLYAHLSRFNVQVGQRVGAGDLIGWSGNTGRSTGPHLHFEIRRNGRHQDPMRYLP